MVTDRYRCGEVWLQARYVDEEGGIRLGEAHRNALGESVAACAGDVWGFLFDNLLEAQGQAPRVALAFEGDGEGWAQTLVEGLALAAARELGMGVEQEREEEGQLELWEG